MVVVAEMVLCVHQMLFHIHLSWTHRKLPLPSLLPGCWGHVTGSMSGGDKHHFQTKEILLPPVNTGGLMLKYGNTHLRSLDP